MTDNLYDIGDRPVLTATFKDPESKELVDPDVVVCTVRPPDSTVAEQLTPTVEKVSTGVYRTTLSVDRAGRWWYAFDGAGDNQASQERSFTVREQQVPR
jgi:hypothetical protein